MRWLALVTTAAAACTFSPGAASVGNDATGSGSNFGSGSGSGDAGMDSGCTDVDHDGICDSVDDWLCGIKPAAPGDGTAAGRPTWIPKPSNVAAVSFGAGALKQAAPGAILTFHYAYGISVPCSGATCNAQIEFGMAGVGRAGCLFDGTVGNNIFEGQLNQQAQIAAPSTSGVYEVRAKIGTSQNCGGSANWFGGTEPPSSGTFAIICVP